MTVPVSLRVGKNMLSLEYKSDPSERATQIAAQCDALGGYPTFLGGARWVISSVNSGAKTFVNADPAGGAGMIGFDDQLIGWYVLRESTGETALITDSVKSTQTITLTAWITGMANGEYVQIRRTEPGTGIHSSGCGLQPHYLEHPVYVASSFPGIGVKFRMIDRTGLIGVPNLCPNAFMRTWANPSALPDGYGSFDVYSGLPASTFGGTFSQNTDPLYTQFGGQSLFFSAGSGTLVTPPIKFAPTYDHQYVSMRVSLFLSSWGRPGDYLRLSLGIKLADGTIKNWLENDYVALAQPTNKRPDPWQPLAGGTWVTLGKDALDITVPSNGLPYTLPVTQADIDALATDAQGLVVMLNIYADTVGPPSGEFVEGYWDATTLVASGEGLPEFTEFGDANKIWQGTNVALALLAKPQVAFSGDVVDFKRMNDDLDEAALDKGTLVAISNDEIGIVNELEVISEARINELVPGDTSITIESRFKRFTQRVVSGARKTSKRIATQIIRSNPPGPISVIPPSVPPGGGGPPSITLSGSITSDVPTTTATVSPGVISVKFATDPAAYPDFATTDAATPDTTPPFAYDGTDGMGGAMTPGDFLYVSAIAYDVNGVASALANVLIEDPNVFSDPGVQVDDMPIEMADSFGAGTNQSKKRWDFVGGFPTYSGGFEVDGDEFTYFQDVPTQSSLPHPYEDARTFAYDLNGQTVPAYGMPLVRYYGPDVGDIVILMLRSDRTLQHVAWDGAAYTAVGSPSTAQWPASGLTFGESRIKLDSANSFAWFRIENVLALHDENIDLTSVMTSGIDTVAVGQGSGPDYTYDPSSGNGGVAGGKWKHLAAFDPTGQNQYDYVGRAKVAAVAPTAPGTYTDSSASASDVATDNGDTSYANNTATNNKDTFTVAAPVGGIVTILGVLPYAYMRSHNTSGAVTACSFRLILLSGATLVDSGADISVPITYKSNVGTSTTPNRWAVMNDPNTSAPWDTTGLTNVEVGAKATLVSTAGPSVNEIRFSQLGTEYVYRD